MGDAVYKFIIISFLALGLAFYELSGGADFEPEQRIVVATAEAAPTPAAVIAPASADVTRSNAASLIALNPQVTTVSLETAQPTVAEPTVIQVAAPAPAPAVAETPEPEVVEVAAEPTPPADIRAVAGSRVNMRQGPGTNFSVLDTLDGGTQTEVLETNGDGWARIQVVSTGQIGWMAERLLTDG